MSIEQVILLGCVGGLLPDAIRLVKNRHTRELPAYLKSPNFYLGLVLLMILGGAAAYLLKPDDPGHALLYGYSAPELITRMAANVSEQGVERATRAAGSWSSLRKWWSTA